MSKRLYVFVDESGNPTHGDYYVVTGCWCVSRRDDPGDVLRPTVDRLTAFVDAQREQSTTLPELRGAKLPPSLVELAVPSIGEFQYDDKTIVQASQHLPWRESLPVRFSIHEINPDLGVTVLDDLFGATDTSYHALKTLSLAATLNPLFSDERVPLDDLSGVRVLLDAEVWQNPADRLERALSVVREGSLDVSCDSLDSRTVPGIQVADLAAYSWARHFRKGDCGNAAATLHGARFSDE